MRRQHEQGQAPTNNIIITTSKSRSAYFLQSQSSTFSIFNFKIIQHSQFKIPDAWPWEVQRATISWPWPWEVQRSRTCGFHHQICPCRSYAPQFPILIDSTAKQDRKLRHTLGGGRAALDIISRTHWVYWGKYSTLWQRIASRPPWSVFSRMEFPNFD